jgi:hypothetical protein
MSSPIVQGRLLWCDAEANCHRMADRAGVADIVEKASRAKINTLIVDVKPLGGEVLYMSKHAPRLGVVDGFAYPESFDLLQAMIEEGHARGIRIHAAINVFSEGHREWDRGPAYQHPEWQATMYEGIWHIGFPGGQSVTVELLDPWNPSDEPVIYTRKSGQTRSCDAGKICTVISDSRVVAVMDDPAVPVDVPSDGCVLSLPKPMWSGVRVGDAVSFSAEPAFRSAQESRVSTFGIFVNPIGPAREHELKIIEEIVSRYDIDGIIFDRMRYPNLYADFGPETRAAFEAWLGHGNIEWPNDVFRISDLPWMLATPGRYYKDWLEWRAWQIHDFASDASLLVRSTKPGVTVGAYVGSWYESYYDVGVNWGSTEFHAGYSWMTPEYNRTGYAEFFDYMCTGCYYPLATKAEARATGRPEGATVEAACELSRQATHGAAPVYGSLYLRDYDGKPDDFRRAIEVTVGSSDGVMLFDLVYLDKYGWWPLLEAGFPEKSIAPHDQPAASR